MNPGVVPMIAPNGSSGDIPFDRVKDATAAGFKTAVVMTSPDGQMGYVPQERAADALKAGFKVGQPTTQFEKDRNPDTQPGIIHSGLNEVGSMIKGGAQMVAGAFSPTPTAMSGVVKNALDVPEQDAQRKAEGRSAPYRATAAVASVVPSTNVPESEQQMRNGNWRGVLGTALADAAPVAAAPAIEAGVKKFGPAVEKFAGSQVDKFQGTSVQRAVVPEASGLSPKAISGAEDIIRAAAPTGKNPGFRENVMVAAPDLADIARKTKIEEAKGGIVNPDMRVRATVNAIDSHLDQMYKTERVPQIQAHADVPVKVGAGEDSVRGLEYLENTAGTAEIRNLAEKALGKIGEKGQRSAPQPLTLAETDTLAQAANKYLKNFERAPSDVQMQMLQTSPKVGGLKALDTELGRSINDVLTSNGEIGIRNYERRYAALSEVRNQLRDRMNATELKQEGLFGAVGRVTRPIGKLIKEGPSGVPSASQAAVSDVNVGRTLQTGLQKLRESNASAQSKR